MLQCVRDASRVSSWCEYEDFEVLLVASMGICVDLCVRQVRVLTF